MTQPADKTLRITDSNKISVLSKAQKLFNKLIKNIETKRQELLSWQNVLPDYQKKYRSELEPALKTFNECRIEFVNLLDEAHAKKSLNKKEKEKISVIISSIIAELFNQVDDNNGLKQLYTKHSGSNLDEEIAEENDLMKHMMEEMLGVDLDDGIDFRSPEELMRNIGEKMRQKISQDNEKRLKKKKSAAAIARDKKREEDEKNVSQSIREIYRKLSSALHPDREQDSIERDKKTAMMQRVNVAYKNNDLLSLLELQLEIEQIDQKMIYTISEEKINHYNKILSEQLSDIKMEIIGIKTSFNLRFNVTPNRRLSPKTAIPQLERNIKSLEKDIDSVKNDLSMYRNIAMLKCYLKTYIIAPNYEKDFRDIINFGFI